jgi:uncharacterized CHY-type Zn-finger protein
MQCCAGLRIKKRARRWACWLCHRSIPKPEKHCLERTAWNAPERRSLRCGQGNRMKEM